MTRFLQILLALFVVPAWSFAEEEPVNPAQVQLVSEVMAVEAGKPFYVGVHLQMPKGYHTYWRGPGIVGIPTGIDWKLPKGFKAGEIEWPVPQRVDMASINAHGYRREVLLMIEITPPDRLAEGSEIIIEGEATWMCCAKTCHPGYQTLSLTLPIDQPKPDPKWAPAFAKSRTELPDAEVDDDGTVLWKASVSAQDAERLTLQITPAAEASGLDIQALGDVYFFSADDQIQSDEPQKVIRNEDGSLELILTISEFGPKDPKTLPGLVWAENGWGKSAIPATVDKRDPRRFLSIAPKLLKAECQSR